MPGESYFTGDKGVKELSLQDFDDVDPKLLKGIQCGLVLFYASWCPHCKSFSPVWSKLGSTAAFASVLAVQCDSSEGKKIMDRLLAADKNFLEGYPTIYRVENGKITSKYEGPMDSSAILQECMACKVGDKGVGKAPAKETTSEPKTEYVFSRMYRQQMGLKT